MLRAGANGLGGCIVSGGGFGRTNTWDSQNRLVQTMYNGVTSSFTYGADGLRRSATAGGVTTHYVLDGQNVVQEVTGTDRVTTLWGPRGPEARIAPDGTALWYVYDGHGNVLGEVDANGVLNPDSSGNPTAARVFDPWGYVLNWQQVADNGNPLKYCGSLGHPSENATGLIYMRARYYDPLLGRFISEDPAKDGGNWYAYAGGNPVGNVDPDGRFAEDYIKAEGDLAALAWAKGAIAHAYAKALGNLIAGVVGTQNLLVSYNAKTQQVFYEIITGAGKYTVRLDLGGHGGRVPAHVNSWLPRGADGHMIGLNELEKLVDILCSL